MKQPFTSQFISHSCPSRTTFVAPLPPALVVLFSLNQSTFPTSLALSHPPIHSASLPPSLPRTFRCAGDAALIGGELRIIKCSILVAKKHVGPHVKTKEPEMFQCQSHPLKKEKRENSTDARTPTGSSIGGVLEGKMLWHTRRTTFQFCLFIWMEWNIYIGERPRRKTSPLSHIFPFFFQI